jgi:hypothetical protein
MNDSGISGEQFFIKLFNKFFGTNFETSEFETERND